jgi:diguanylate cyclase (GGDEF)-like protein/PAS domain S-box-containing protein
MDQFNQAHILLAGQADSAGEFFRRAVQAIAVASECRWAGVGFSRPESGELEVVAFWDGNGLGQGFRFDIAGSPCERVYQAAPANAHVYYAEDIQKTFSTCDLLRQLGVESYRGQAFYCEDRQVIGHIFALDDKPQVDRPEVRFFFELLSQRMGAECRRFNQRDALQKLSLAITHSPVLTVITDPNGIIEYVSPIVEKITGYRPEEVIGKTPSLFKSGRTDRKLYRELWSAIKEKRAWQGELENRRKNGEYYWESISIAPVLNQQGELVAFVGISMDISERKQMEQQLKELASTDPLTGIFNRRHFMEEVDSQLAYSKRYGTPLSFMIIDIDHFKQLNDQGGHALGDEAILRFTRVAQETIRVVDIFGRLGGDEFAIALPDTGDAEALVLAQRLKDKVSRLMIRNDVHSSQMTISIGLATFRNRVHDGESVHTLLRRADKALYEAKRRGRNLIGVS